MFYAGKLLTFNTPAGTRTLLEQFEQHNFHDLKSHEKHQKIVREDKKVIQSFQKLCVTIFTKARFPFQIVNLEFSV